MGDKMEQNQISVGDLKKALEGIDDSVLVIVRTDYYYEYADSAYYNPNFSEDHNMRGPGFIIEGG
jgi:hypothetical protein